MVYTAIGGGGVLLIAKGILLKFITIQWLQWFRNFGNIK